MTGAIRRSLLSRGLKTLRSRKLAVWLFIGIAAYSAVAMSIPQRPLGASKAAAWRAANPTLGLVVGLLRLDDAFSSPAFLAAMALLFAVTAACAWARTRTAIGLRRPTGDGDKVAEALDRRPAMRLPGVSLKAAEEGLRSHGYRVRRGARYAEADRRTWGVFCSPIFHWALALLVAVIGLGTLTRSEGVIDIPIGERVADVAETYQRRVRTGPLFAGYTGYELSARDLQVSTVLEGIERGHSAVVDVYRQGARVASGRVYPNSPVRYGPLLIHRTGIWGYAPLVSLETTGGQEVARARVIIDQSRASIDAVGPGRLYYSDRSGENVLSVSIPYSRSATSTVRKLSDTIRVTVKASGEPTSAPVTISEGQSAPVGAGLDLRFVQRGHFVQVSVANDWSVPYMYALFAVAVVGLMGALFAPMRRVWIAPGGSDEALHVYWRRPAADPAFADGLERLLTRGAGETRDTTRREGGA